MTTTKVISSPDEHDPDSSGPVPEGAVFEGVLALFDAETGELIEQPATEAQIAASDEAREHDGGAGIILIDDNYYPVPPCDERLYADQGSFGPLRRAYVSAP